MTLRLVLSSCFALLLVGSSAHAQWSTIKGKFTVVGEVPVLKPLACAAAGACCAKPIPDQSLVVSANKELANVFVYARAVKKTNPAFKAGVQPLVLKNAACMFEPHAAILWTQQPLEMVNADNVGHNMNFTSAVQGFNELIQPNGKAVKNLAVSENTAKPISCNIHPWMQAQLLVRDNPYFAVSAADGTFEIKDVPNDEEIEYQLWHEKSGYLGNLKFIGGAVDAKGRFKLKIAKDTDLGEIKVAAKENLKL